MTSWLKQKNLSPKGALIRSSSLLFFILFKTQSWFPPLNLAMDSKTGPFAEQEKYFFKNLEKFLKGGPISAYFVSAQGPSPTCCDFLVSPGELLPLHSLSSSRWHRPLPGRPLDSHNCPSNNQLLDVS